MDAFSGCGGRCGLRLRGASRGCFGCACRLRRSPSTAPPRPRSAAGPPTRWRSPTAGPDKSPAKLRFTRGHGATDVDDGERGEDRLADGIAGQLRHGPHGVICRPGAIAAGETVKVEVVMKVFDADLPKLAVQATVAPELVPGVDTNSANDHAETSTPVREPIAARRAARQLRQVAVQAQGGDRGPEGEADEGDRRRQGAGRPAPSRS